MLQLAFGKIRTQVLESGREKEELQRANQVHLYFTQKYALLKWASKASKKAQLMENVFNALQFRYMVDLKTAWMGWCKGIIRKHQIQVKKRMIEAVFERIHIKRHFYALLEYTRNIKSVKVKQQALKQARNMQAVKQTFSRWKRASSHRYLKVIDARCFREERERYILDNSFVFWSSLSRKSASLHYRLNKFLIFQNKGNFELEYFNSIDTLAFVFMKWNSKLRNRRMGLSVQKMAVQYNSHNLLTKYLLSWKTVYRHKLWIDVRLEKNSV